MKQDVSASFACLKKSRGKTGVKVFNMLIQGFRILHIPNIKIRAFP